MFEKEFLVVCLLFDEEAASSYADIDASRTRIGLPITVEDAQIAAIALTRCLIHATRNVGDFALEGLAG